jgi:hypothetical protein
MSQHEQMADKLIQAVPRGGIIFEKTILFS